VRILAMGANRMRRYVKVVHLKVLDRRSENMTKFLLLFLGILGTGIVFAEVDHLSDEYWNWTEKDDEPEEVSAPTAEELALADEMFNSDEEVVTE